MTTLRTHNRRKRRALAPLPVHVRIRRHKRALNRRIVEFFGDGPFDIAGVLAKYSGAASPDTAHFVLGSVAYTTANPDTADRRDVIHFTMGDNR